MILNDIWHQFNQNIQSSDGTDLDRKQSAVNMGQLYLLQRFIEVGIVPDEFIANPTALLNTTGNNYCSLPSDFLAINRAQVWRQQIGGSYWPLGQNAIITYSDLLIRVGQNFFDPTDVAEPLVCAIKEPNLYLDHYLANYFFPPETITGATSGATAKVVNQTTTSLSLNAISGAFQVGEKITGSTSQTLGTINGDNSQTLTVNNLVLNFQVGEVVTGTSGATGLITSLPSLPEVVIKVTSGTFSLGEIITGGTSNAYATIISYTDDVVPITITGGKQRIKIGYVKTTTDIVVYDELPLNTVIGTFQVGEIITGATSSASAMMVYLPSSSSLGLQQIFGTFQVGETVTGKISGSVAIVDKVLILKPATLAWGNKYKTVLIEACGLLWHRLKGSNEVASRSAVVDNMITMMSVTNDNTYAQWGLA